MINELDKAFFHTNCLQFILSKILTRASIIQLVVATTFSSVHLLVFIHREFSYSLVDNRNKFHSDIIMEINNNILHLPDRSNRYNEMESLGHLIIHNLTKEGDKTMLINGLSGEELSATQLMNKSIEIAKALLAAGLKQGDVVSIISENRFEFAFVMFGTIFNNCVFAPVNNTYSEREIEHALKLSKPKIVFVSHDLSKKVVKVIKTLRFIEKVILLDDESSTDKMTVHLKDFTNPKKLKSVNFMPRAVDRVKTVCLVMCSSGTTGLPKGVQISQDSIIVTAKHTKDNIMSEANVGTGEKVVLGLLPLFHAFGASVLICGMAASLGKIVMLPKFEENSFLRCIQDYHCSVVFAVPPLMVFLAKHGLVEKFDLSSLRLILCGAAPLSKELELAVSDRLKNPNLVVKQGYGMTELTVGVLTQKEIIKPGSVGDLNSGVYAKVIDDDGNALGPHKRGELCFKGSVLMIGYINDPIATSATIDDEGWLHTGDVGYYDEDFQFFIVDRIKELIKWKGFQVPPAGRLAKWLI